MEGIAIGGSCVGGSTGPEGQETGRGRSESRVSGDSLSAGVFLFLSTGLWDSSVDVAAVGVGERSSDEEPERERLCDTGISASLLFVRRCTLAHDVGPPLSKSTVGLGREREGEAAE